MAETNPYNAPGSQVGDAAVAYSDPKFFGMGRLGRLRYFGYSIVATFILYFVLGIAAAILIPVVGSNPDAAAGIGGLLYFVAVVVGLVIAVFLGVQRLHDMGYSGWLWLLLLVPLVNIIMSLFLLFAPGNAGETKYGLPPRPNGAGVYVIAFGGIFLFVAMIGVIAAIAIPQYNAYLEQAQQYQSEPYYQDQTTGDGYNRNY